MNRRTPADGADDGDGLDAGTCARESAWTGTESIKRGQNCSLCLSAQTATAWVDDDKNEVFMKRFVLICACVLLAAHDAAAQGFIVPFIGTTLTSPGPSGDRTKPGYGVAFGGMGKIVGAETEIAYYPEVIDSAPNAIAKSRVIFIFGRDAHRSEAGPVPTLYFAIGAGNLNLNVTGVASVL